MEVVYNVTYKIKDNLIINDDEMKNIITKKLLRVILNLENNNKALYNS